MCCLSRSASEFEFGKQSSQAGFAEETGDEVPLGGADTMPRLDLKWLLFPSRRSFPGRQLVFIARRLVAKETSPAIR
jgi:hypothetical protein